MSMEQTWRWYGPKDPVTLNDIRQAGAVGVVTALHEIPAGKIWPVEAIKERKNAIEWDFSFNPPHPTGLNWSVVESIPVHEDIKTGKGNVREYIENYKQSIRNLGECDINTVCYNFMPVVDWTRTDLSYLMPDGSEALRFNATAFAAFDLFMLERKEARENYSEERIDKARSYFDQLNFEDKKQLQNNIIAGLPGGHEGYTLKEFTEVLNIYEDISEMQLRENLAQFLREIIPVAEKAGVKMAIHPDDPPRSLFGLPRVVSREDDLKFLLNVIASPANGFTMCTGSYGVRPDNDLPGMIERYGEKMHFIHLRSTKREDEDPESFFEADHLAGDVDMYEVVKAILEEEAKRKRNRNAGKNIPMRPDHGHKMLDDLQKQTNPGYSAIGRLRGLGELRGLELGIEKSLFSNNISKK